MSDDYCTARTQGSPPFYRGTRCSRKAVRDGFCSLHHPEAKAKRREASVKRGDENLDKWRKEHDFRTKRPADYRAALTLIAAGVEPAQQIAKEALAKWGEDEKWQEP